MKKSNLTIKAGCSGFAILSLIISLILKEIFHINGWLSLGMVLLLMVVIAIYFAFKCDKEEKKKKEEEDERIVNISAKYPLAYAAYLDKLKIKSFGQFIDSERRDFLSTSEDEWKVKEEELKKSTIEHNNVSLAKETTSKENTKPTVDNSSATNKQDEIPFVQESKDMYFDSFMALKDIKNNALLQLEYLRPSNNNFRNDVFMLMDLMQDKETEKYFPEFYGDNCANALIRYLENTCQVTFIGIGFAYLMKEFGTYTCGIVKVTTPAHNRVTNNFNHWLIDFIVVPQSRGKGFATHSVKNVLSVVKGMGAKEIFAMVDCENKASMKVLEKCGFYQTQLFDVGINPHTKNKVNLYRKLF